MSDQVDEYGLTKSDREFWTQHCQSPSGVVVVSVYPEGSEGDATVGIFSTLEAAHLWRDTFGDDYAAMFVPYVIDAPEWGNQRGH